MACVSVLGPECLSSTLASVTSSSHQKALPASSLLLLLFILSILCNQDHGELTYSIYTRGPACNAVEYVYHFVGLCRL